MNRYSEYKESGVEWVGEVPEHWKTHRLKEIISKLEQGWSPNAATWPADKGEYGVLKLSAISGGKFIESENKELAEHTSLGQLEVSSGVLLITRSNTPSLVGECCPVNHVPYTNLIVPDLIFAITPSVRLTALAFLAYQMNSASFRWLKRVTARGLNDSMVKISQGTIKNWRLLTPPLPEQTAIAAYLDTKTAQIDRQIDLLSQKATQYRNLKQSLINETVTRGLDKSVPMKDSGVEWIGEVPMHWEMTPIRNLLENRLDKNVGNTEVEYLSLVAGIGVIPYAEKGNVGNKKPEDLEKCKMVFEGDFVLNSMNFGIGSFGISRYNGVCSSVYIVMRPKRISNGEFLHRIFQVKPFQKFMSSYGKGIMEIRMAIKWEHLKTIEIPCPPLIEQTAIAVYLDDKAAQIDRIVTAINTHIDKLKDLRKALINDVVTGKIKVVSEGQAA